MIRRATRAFLFAATFAIASLCVALILSQTGWFKRQVRDLIISQTAAYLNGTLTIGRLGGNLFTGVEMTDVTLRSGGREIIRIKDVGLQYSIAELVSDTVVLQRLRLNNPTVALTRLSDGSWDIRQILKRDAQQGDRKGPRRPIWLQHVDVTNGEVRLSDRIGPSALLLPRVMQKVDLSLQLRYRPVELRVSVEKLSFEGYSPQFRVTKLTGDILRNADGLSFQQLAFRAQETAFSLDGTIGLAAKPVRLGLRMRSETFAFQEIARIIPGLSRIHVTGALDVALDGPLSAVQTATTVRSPAGDLDSKLVVDFTKPGWHAAGAADLNNFQVGPWFDKAPDIAAATGQTTFDLDLGLGRHFPRGSYTFVGPHAAFRHYRAADVVAHGRITDTDVMIDAARARAYGSPVITRGRIALASPYRFRLEGQADHVDLRLVPGSVPVPKVTSDLTFQYDIGGQFIQPELVGRAVFEPSSFLHATIERGMVGTIDTTGPLVAYTAEGFVAGLNPEFFGRSLGLAWLAKPRYAGEVAGRFVLRGSGATAATLSLVASGQVTQSALFGGKLDDLSFSIDIGGGSLQTQLAGAFKSINLATLLDQAEWQTALAGRLDVRATLPGLLVSGFDPDRAAVAGKVSLDASRVKRVHVDHTEVAGQYKDGVLTFEHAKVEAEQSTLEMKGRLALWGASKSDFQYDLQVRDASRLAALINQPVRGAVASSGTATGPPEALTLNGELKGNNAGYGQTEALSLSVRYRATVPIADPASGAFTGTGTATFVESFGQTIDEVTGDMSYARTRLSFDARIRQRGRQATLAASLTAHPDHKEVHLNRVELTLPNVAWRTLDDGRDHTVSWSGETITISPTTFVGGLEQAQQLSVAGSLGTTASATIRFDARNVSLETVNDLLEGSEHVAGTLNGYVVVAGALRMPTFLAEGAITDGAFRTVKFESVTGRISSSSADQLALDVRLDQAPGVWLIANGTIRRDLFSRGAAQAPVDVTLKSSRVDLGLIAGLTSAFTNVVGAVEANVRVTGVSSDPHFEGTIDIENAAFTIAATGASYKNGTMSVHLVPDLVTVEELHVEDAQGDGLDVTGSLGLHELRVGRSSVTLTASAFEVLRDDIGTVDINAILQMTGDLDAPVLVGDAATTTGTLRVDRILEEAAFRRAPSVGAPAGAGSVPGVNTFWDRLRLGLRVTIPGNFIFTGEDLHVEEDTPVGVGDISITVGADLTLRKSPGGPFTVAGAVDTVRGTYTFQGRRFELQRGGTIRFDGTPQLNPALALTADRVISGIETRVALGGTLRAPTLTLSSVPPLEQADVLSLIVFNQPTNALADQQAQDLAVRAGALAAGFLTAPLTGSLAHALGVDLLAVEPVADAGGAGLRVTIGENFGDRLFVQYSRLFGATNYNEARIEYQIRRYLTLRGVLVDGDTGISRRLFQRLERTGVDLLFFFSY